jgi:hypothetical protein
MNLRLVVVWGDQKRTFEHPGPVVHVGRDAAQVDLPIDSAKVGRRHAKIELATDGATLTDLGSANRTLLNDQLIEQHVPMAIHVGDRIQFGRAGAALLTVVGLDLSPAAPPAESSPRPLSAASDPVFLPKQPDGPEAEEHPAVPLPALDGWGQEGSGEVEAAPAGRRRRVSPLLWLSLALVLLVGVAGGAVYFYRDWIWPAPQPVREKHGRYALLIGVNKYENADTFAELAFAENDVNALAEVLREAKYDEVVLLTTTEGKEKGSDYKPSGENIRREVKRLLARCEEGDTLILAFSGHGHQVNSGNDLVSYFCPCDADVQANHRSAIALTEVYQTLAEKPGVNKVILVDACRPGKDGKAGIAGRKVPDPGPGTSVLFSSSQYEPTSERQDLGTGHGVFFYCVVQGLKGKANKDGAVTLESLNAYVEKEVARLNPGQTPHLRVHQLGGSPVLVRWGREAPESPIDVSGTVSRNGTRVQAGDKRHLRVALFSDRNSKSFTAVVRPDGTFDLFGVPPGRYRVAVELLDDETSHDEFEGRHSREKTKFTCHVKADMAVVEIDLGAKD